MKWLDNGESELEAIERHLKELGTGWTLTYASNGSFIYKKQIEDNSETL